MRFSLKYKNENGKVSRKLLCRPNIHESVTLPPMGGAPPIKILHTSKNTYVINIIYSPTLKASASFLSFSSALAAASAFYVRAKK